MKKVDCRGLNCPEPVLRTKKALDEESTEPLEIIVDNETARDNVLRFLGSRGYNPTWEEKEGFYYLQAPAAPGKTGEEKASAGDRSAVQPAEVEKAPGIEKNTVLLISSDQLGTGSVELGQLLMRNFIYTLAQGENIPPAMVFMNAGVKLTIRESPVRDELLAFQERGVQILVCGTCLDYYKLKEVHFCGQVSNMYDISELMLDAEKVLTI